MVHRETFTERKPGETPNDYNDRVIRLAATWYNKHLTESDSPQQQQVKVVLLTNDRANKEKALEEGILAYTGM